MPQPTATITNVAQAHEVIKEMNLHGYEWGSDYRTHGRAALKVILEGQMRQNIDSYLEELSGRDGVDRRNGSYNRHLLTELGDIELNVPRTRHYSALKVVRAYARRAPHIDRMILACFVLGVSTRKVAEAQLPVLGERISASTVSRVGQQLDKVVEAFHAWRKATRTTNGIERRFREVRRRTRPMGVFFDRTSVERILFAVFTCENKQQGIATPFLLAQNS